MVFSFPTHVWVGGGSPLDIGSDGSLAFWWDFSESEGTFNYTDNPPTIAVSNGSDLKTVTDRSGNAVTGIAPAGFVGTWDASVRNGNGAWLASETPTLVLIVNAAAYSGVTQPFTVVAIAHVDDSADNGKERVLFGPTVNDGTTFGFDDEAAGADARKGFLWSRESSPAHDELDYSPVTRPDIEGNWYMFLLEINGASSLAEFNSDDASLSHDAGVVQPATLRLGSGNSAPATPTNGWNSYIGDFFCFDKQLSASEKTDLFGWAHNKWNLTHRIP